MAALTTVPQLGSLLLDNSLLLVHKFQRTCFLCDRVFAEDEFPNLIFENRLSEDGQIETSLSSVLASALGREVEETGAHSTLLCDACNSIVLEYEALEQRLCKIRFRILTTFNRTALRNHLMPITFEINGVLHTLDSGEVVDNAEHPANDDVDETALFVNKSDLENNTELTTQFEESNIAPASFSEANTLFGNATLTMRQDNVLIEEAFHEQLRMDEESLGLSSMDRQESKFDPGLVILDEKPQCDLSDLIVYDEMTDEASQADYSDANITEDSQSQSLKDFDDHDNQSSDIMYVFGGSDLNSVEDLAPDTEVQQESSDPMYDSATDLYTCNYCSLPNPMERTIFRDHLRKVHNKRFYTCEICKRILLRRSEYNSHMELGHNSRTGPVIYECEQCQRSFSNLRLFRVHKRLHYQVTKNHECDVCQKKFNSRNLLEQHKNMHTGKRPFKCTECPKDFASKYTLQTHKKIHTERLRPFQCDVCHRAFLNLQNLTQHKKLHSPVKSFQCDKCPKIFSTKHNLNVHSVVHTGNKPFMCRTCGKAFARRAEIRDHERIHTGERPFKCDQCAMAFAQRSNLMAHKKSTHLNEKQHKCEWCSRTFKRRRLLNYHIQSVHTGERPYECQVCKSSFVYPEHYKKHLLIHGGTKPYACEVCGKQFYSRDNRNAHRFVHSEKKPYECVECGAGYMRKPLLLAHMKYTKHGNETIIVNQHLSKAGDSNIVLSSYEVNYVDAQDAVENCDEMFDELIESANEEIELEDLAALSEQNIEIKTQESSEDESYLEL